MRNQYEITRTEKSCYVCPSTCIATPEPFTSETLRKAYMDNLIIKCNLHSQTLNTHFMSFFVFQDFVKHLLYILNLTI